jgi:hypothetical protein
MKTLKQRFKQWETTSYTQESNHISTLIALDEVKQWLTQKRKKWIDAPNPDMQNWTMIRSMIILEYKKLLEEL